MNIVSLFSGIGGIDLAFKRAGFDISFANDIDYYAAETYKKNIGDICLWDIKNLDVSIIPYADMIVAGFPCQSFSSIGKQYGFNDAKGMLFYDLLRVIDFVKPEVLFFENVANLVEHNNGKTFQTMKIELKSRGYYIKYKVMNAMNYQIPQFRNRVYIVGFKDYHSCYNFEFPDASELIFGYDDWIDLLEEKEEYYYLPTNSKRYALLEKLMVDGEMYLFKDRRIVHGYNKVSLTLMANMGTWNNRIPFVKDKYGIRVLTPEECLLLMSFPAQFEFADIPMAQKYKQVGNSVCVGLVENIAANIKKALMEV